MIVLMIWNKDDPITGNVINITNIVEPRKAFDDYKVGDKVDAKCPGFGVVSGIIGKIGDDGSRKAFQQILAGSEFGIVVNQVLHAKEVGIPIAENTKQKEVGIPIAENTKQKEVGIPIAETPKRKRAEDMDLDDQPDSDDSCVSVSILSGASISKCRKKTSTAPDGKAQADQASKAKKKEAAKKREMVKSREKVNKEFSLDLLDHQGVESVPVDTALILEKLTTIIANQKCLEQKLEELKTCRQCAKNMYKMIALPTPKAAVVSAPPRVVSPSPRVVPPSPYVVPAPPRIMPGDQATPNSLNDCTEDEGTGEMQATQLDSQECVDDGNTDELTFLGDSRYGVRVNRKRLHNCEMASSKIDKLALNILELLVTKEECANLSVYGQAKGKVAMASDKRKALRSHIFQIYGKGLKEEEKETVWTTDIVRKLNDKIRGIKNNKYKL